jgi:Overcoming lysogenization defect protein-like, TOPRIM domain/AAA domain, putative AbiEii toxin, Type IV TA system
MLHYTPTPPEQSHADITSLHGFAAWLEHHIESATAWLMTGRFVVSSSDDGYSWECRYEARDTSAALFWWDLRTPGIRATAEATSASVSSLFVAWRERLPEEERHALDRALASQPEGRFPDHLDLHDLPAWVNPAYDKPLGVQKWNRLGPAPHLNQRLDSLLHAERPGSQATSGSAVWKRLFDAAFVFTDNVRLPPHTQYTAVELDEAPIDLSDGRDLAVYLYRLSVGNNVVRKTYAQIQTLFHTLTGRTFEVVRPEQGSVRAGPRTGIGTAAQSDDSTRAVGLVIEADWGDVPLGFSGAGITEALYMSTLLAGGNSQVVMLDEPALNLHPTLMSSLVTHLLAHEHRPEEGRSQFFVSTHSPWLVPADALDRVARFTLGARGQTILHGLRDPAGPNLDDAQLAELRNLVRKSPSAAALLFSRAVLLVEGETELGALPVWWDAMQQDVALYSVGGKGNFVGPVKFLNRFAIPWAILCDGDALWDRKQHSRTHGPDLHVRAILNASARRLRAGATDPTTDAGFQRWRRRLERFGIFTLANSADAGFEQALQAETPVDVWASAHNRFDDNKVAVGRYVAENCVCSPSLERLMRRIVHHLNLQGAGLSRLEHRATSHHS